MGGFEVCDTTGGDAKTPENWEREMGKSEESGTFWKYKMKIKAASNTTNTNNTHKYMVFPYLWWWYLRRPNTARIWQAILCFCGTASEYPHCHSMLLERSHLHIYLTNCLPAHLGHQESWSGTKNKVEGNTQILPSYTLRNWYWTIIESTILLNSRYD